MPGGDEAPRAWIGALIFVLLASTTIVLLELGRAVPQSEEEETPEWLQELDEMTGEESSTKHGGDRFGLEGESGEDRRDRLRDELLAHQRTRAGELTASTLERFASDEAVGEYMQGLTELTEIQRRIDELSPQQQPGRQAPMDAPAGPDSITNNQVGGVDEGDIVKARGDLLVVLRRGRLFSLRVGEDGELTALSRIDVPTEASEGGWYDELLLFDDRALVLGFDYSVGASELSIFDLDDDGRFTRVSRHYFESGDYYSSRDYASRRIGDRLVFYLPASFSHVEVPEGEEDAPEADDEERGPPRRVLPRWPGVREASDEEYTPLLGPEQVYRPLQPVLSPALHTIVSCDVSGPRLSCDAHGVLGPRRATRYVARDAVYLWVGPEWQSSWDSRPRLRAEATMLYRIPLVPGEPVTAARVAGQAPSGSSRSTSRTTTGSTCSCARSSAPPRRGSASARETSRCSVSRSGASARAPGASRPGRTRRSPASRTWATGVRFVGDHLVYGSGGSVSVLRYARGRDPVTLELEHEVARIDAMGPRAVVVGPAEGGLGFSAIGLGASPAVEATHVEGGMEEAETRTHGFFYRARSETEGWLGVATHRTYDSITFLDVDNDEEPSLVPVGHLVARRFETNDHCRASCSDWYGNARPVFYRDRIFALLGYELVEGRVEDGDLDEVGRVHMFRDTTAD